MADTNSNNQTKNAALNNTGSAPPSSVKVTAEALEDVYAKKLVEIKSEMSPDLKNGIVNILKSYDWAVNYRDSKAELPAVYVKEYRQNLSTFAASLNWFVNGAQSAIVGGTNSGGDNLKKIWNYLSSANETEPTEDKLQNIANSKTSYDSISGKLANNKNNQFEKMIGRYSDNVLSPYSYMYSLTEENCLKYVFPYFDNDFISFNSSFGDKAQTATTIQNMLSEQLGNFAGISGLLGDSLNIGSVFSDQVGWNDQGIYIEKPKYFQFEGSGDKVLVRFTLFNTVAHEGGMGDADKNPWKKNYRFISNFAFKNLPFKISMFRYKTPALYEVSIPGIKYFPISYVSSFKVDLRGTRRYLDYNGLKVLVPEAWDVNITFQSLLYKSANLLQAALTKGPNILSY